MEQEYKINCPHCNSTFDVTKHLEDWREEIKAGIIEEYKTKVKAKGSKNAQNNIKSIKSKDLQGKSTAQDDAEHLN